jgi:4-amino-4-deoxy-L-arabinose transferase-like glycosyltransferase
MFNNLITSVLAPPRRTEAPGLGEDASLATPPARPPEAPSQKNPPWIWSALLTVVLLAAGLYLWNLSRNGWANEYYAAAVLSMTQDWQNFFFASFDPGGFITVDKPPFAFWIQAISARIFGLSSWSILVPEAIAGLATLLVVFHLVRRDFGHAAAIIAALILALTPVTVAVNRDNIPDSALVLLMVLAAWGVLNAISSGRLRTLLVGAALVGLAFNTKMLQAYIVVPSFALTYLLAAPGSVRRRLAYLVAAGLVLLVVSASWMVAVDATPADARPYVGGSTNNTVADLVFGYNGFSRIFGNFGRLGPGAPGGNPAGVNANAPGAGPRDSGPGSGGPPNGGPLFGGQPGWLRLFNGENASQISWLLPLAALGAVAGLVARRGSSRTDPARASLVLWAGWLATHFVVFSLARGIFHPYYTIAMAPAVAALSGTGLVTLWGWYRDSRLASVALPLAIGLAVLWPIALLTQSSWGEPWLRASVGVAAGLAMVGLFAGIAGRRFGLTSLRSVAAPAMALGVTAILIGPGSWSAATLQGGQAGVIPVAGPAGAFAAGPGGRFPAAQPPGANPPAAADAGARGFRTRADDGGLVTPPNGGAPDGGVVPPAGLGGQANQGTTPPDFGGVPGTEFGEPGAVPPLGLGEGPGGPAFGPGRSPGGRLSEQLVQYLVASQGSARFLVATASSMTAAPLILATGKPVMAMGGFGGGDPALPLERLQAMVRSGELRFLLLDGGGPGGGPGGFGPGGFGRGGTQRNDWVRTTCSLVDPTAYGGPSTGAGAQLYDCSGALAPDA